MKTRDKIASGKTLGDDSAKEQHASWTTGDIGRNGLMPAYSLCVCSIEAFAKQSFACEGSDLPARVFSIRAAARKR